MVIVVWAVAYVVFMRRFYYLHEEYLASLKRYGGGVIWWGLLRH